MKFIDEATITVQSGNGGSGCVSFRREKFIPRGGPDGGDGGRGGDVILRSTLRKRTLYQFISRKQFRAGNGAPGQGRQKTGKSGADLTIEVPVGTVVTDTATDSVLKDFNAANETFLVARGGRGGQGNTRFKSATHRTPRFAQTGEPGQTLTLHLELKLLADVGLVGFPNAGKSTLIAAISSAKPKIADYPFTTITPNLGVVQTGASEPFVVADIPGLIEGAHKGTGLGIKFLRHIERTRILLHLIDCFSVDPADPLYSYSAINRELAGFSRALAEKHQIVVLNKMDLPDTVSAAESFKRAMGDMPVFEISAVTGDGMSVLLKELSKIINNPESNDD